MFAIVMLVLFARTSSLEVDAPCPDMNPVDNFKIDSFAKGLWYEIARYPTGWEDHSDCLVAKFSREGNTYKFNISDVFDNTHKSGTFGGDVELAGTVPGTINYISPIYKNFTGSTKMTARIVDIDYDHYCIFYECEYNEEKKMRKDHVWIISRSKTLEPKARKRLDAFFEKNSNILNPSKLIWIHFTPEACESKS